MGGVGRIWDVETGVDIIVYDVGMLPLVESSQDGKKVFVGDKS
jgi:hypothetical protein